MSTIQIRQNLFLVLVFCLAVSQLLAKEPASSSQNSSDPAKALEQQRNEVKTNIEVFQDRVHKRLAQIDEMSRGWDLRQIQHQHIAVEQLRQILRELEEEARQILEAHAMLEPELKMYREALSKGPDLFDRIAKDFERLAVEKKSTMLKEAYLDFSAQARTIGASYTTRSKGIDGLEAELAKKMEFVRESREFLQQIDEFLAAIPAAGGVETEKLVKRVNEYVKAMEAATRSIKAMTNAIGAPETSPKPALPRKSDQASSISQTSDLRNRLLALERK